MLMCNNVRRCNEKILDMDASTSQYYSELSAQPNNMFVRPPVVVSPMRCHIALSCIIFLGHICCPSVIGRRRVLY